jgi:S1-C subfamily serine protease
VGLVLLAPTQARNEDSLGLVPSSSGRVLTLLDYFEQGRLAVDAFLLESPQGSPSDLASIFERAKQTCVRVEVRIGEDEDRYQSLSASGVLIDDGRRVLTAGHVVESAEAGEVLIHLLDGATRRARIGGSRYEVYGGADQDWAVLEIAGPRVDSFPHAELAAPRLGELSIVLGYPDQIGLDSRGRVSFGSGSPGQFLAPLATMAVVDRERPLRLAPTAGAVPTSGMSGAPVFDSQGRVIGIFASVGKQVTATSVTYTLNAATATRLEPLFRRETER